jgi:hypothetical protein
MIVPNKKAHSRGLFCWVFLRGQSHSRGFIKVIAKPKSGAGRIVTDTSIGHYFSCNDLFCT